MIRSRVELMSFIFWFFLFFLIFILFKLLDVFKSLFGFTLVVMIVLNGFYIQEALRIIGPLSPSSASTPSHAHLALIVIVFKATRLWLLASTSAPCSSHSDSYKCAFSALRIIWIWWVGSLNLLFLQYEFAIPSFSVWLMLKVILFCNLMRVQSMVRVERGRQLQSLHGAIGKKLFNGIFNILFINKLLRSLTPFLLAILLYLTLIILR